MGREAARSSEHARAALVEPLLVRREETVATIAAHVQEAVPHPIAGDDTEYRVGVRAATSAMLEHCLEGIRQGSEWPGPVPSEALLQARRAARSGVGLGTVLRSCFAGHRRLGELIAAEAERSGSLCRGDALQQLRQTQDGLLERVAAAIEDEYSRECERIERSSGGRRVEIVQRLLACEPVDPLELSELDYKLHNTWHVALIATGGGAEEVLQRLRDGLGRQCLPVSRGERTATVWLGGQRKLAVTDIERTLSTAKVSADVSLAVGEAGRGIEGWRLTHRQAHAAFEVALRRSQKLTRYADCSLLAAALKDTTLALSLEQKYLTQLGSERDGGAILRQTLRAYIDTECNATSAAGPLNVDRHTVESRVRKVEQLIGRPLRTCLAELDVALCLEELDNPR